MRKLLLLSAACAALAATPARAQINLAWNDCITEPDARSNLDYACDGSRAPSPFLLVFSFVPPVGLDQFVGLEIGVEIFSSYWHPIPDYWRFGTGECGAGNLEFVPRMLGIGTGASGVCRNPWQSITHSIWTPLRFPTPTDPRRARIETGFEQDGESVLIAGQQYVAGVLRVDAAVETDGCGGCDEPLCFLFTDLLLRETAGASGDFLIVTPGIRNSVTWQGGPGTVPCDAVAPARNGTWGAVKQLYR